MSSSLRKGVTSSYQKHNILSTLKRMFNKLTLGDPIEHATGLEKREILAKIAGNTDPFDMGPIIRGPGTIEKPTEIPSAFDARIIGCVCVDEAPGINWMWLHKGQPKRCECGHWFTLVHRAPL